MKRTKGNRGNRVSRWMVTAILFTLAYSLTPNVAQAKVRFGITGGFQLTNMELNNQTLDSPNRMGWFAGPVLKFTLPITGLGIDVSALYDQRDIKVNDEVFKQKSVVVQGNGRFIAGLGDNLSLFMLVGPQFSFNVGDDFEHWIPTKDEYKQFSLQETMLSLNMGVGITIAKQLEGSVRYNMPISKTSDFTWNELSTKLSEETWHHAKSRTTAWSVAITYFF